MANELLRAGIINVMNRRYATKQYDPTKKLDPDDWHTILEVARLSPSSMGFEPWEFLEIQNKELRNKIDQVAWGAQGKMEDCDKVLVVLARKHLEPGDKYFKDAIEFYGRDEKVAAEKLDSFQKEDFDLTTEREKFDWCSKQTYIALGNMMSAAATLGIDTTPVEGFNRPAVEKILTEAGVMNPDDFGVSYMLLFGYRAQPVKPKVRRPLDEIVKVVK